tara:strand:+ start:480 stop:656 length:177 start_codon:yes stop_codon:yes gene_type:complete
MQRKVIEQFNQFMKSGGNGLSTFLMTYSLGQGYLDDDDYKKTIEDNVNEKCVVETKIF